ncbi:MAG: hypothetical protein KBT66_16245 [Amphritea sp.]|nr:hypothetical protein [Amphritea sp.]
MHDCFTSRGFLPCTDPDAQLTLGKEFERLDRLGNALPSLLLEDDCRTFLAQQPIPNWPGDTISPESLPQARLYYLRLGFIASGYINQVHQPKCHTLPRNIAQPLVKIARLLGREPMLSYDGYALYNWKRFDTDKPIELGNIDTLQNFVHLYDEHWFILIHVEIEAIAARILKGIEQWSNAFNCSDSSREARLQSAMDDISLAIMAITKVLLRIPEKMSDQLYFSTFRPYIGHFDDVIYEDTDSVMSFRGETGAQSSIMPVLLAFLKIPHQQTRLLKHLQDMRNYMPAEHRLYIERTEQLPDPKPLTPPELFNEILEGIAQFREVHYHWAIKYIARRSNDQQGTGGTPYLKWLKFLIDETRHYKHNL